MGRSRGETEERATRVRTSVIVIASVRPGGMGLVRVADLGTTASRQDDEPTSHRCDDRPARGPDLLIGATHAARAT
ncbi:MAG: hypothetical protein M3680_32580, partial [Myxococcota bacterium]|nr:hypothetical protein [Myxococcota bacterium]